MPPNDTWITWRMLSNPPWLGAGVSYPGACFSGCPASVFREAEEGGEGERWAEAGCHARPAAGLVCGVSPQCRTSLESQRVPAALSRPPSGVLPTHHAGILSTGVCMRDPAALPTLGPSIGYPARPRREPFRETSHSEEHATCGRSPRFPAGRRAPCLGRTHADGGGYLNPMTWRPPSGRPCTLQAPGLDLTPLVALSKTALDPSARKDFPPTQVSPPPGSDTPPTSQRCQHALDSPVLPETQQTSLAALRAAHLRRGGATIRT